MGQTLSAPVTEKHSTQGSDHKYGYGASCMQGWRVSMEDAHSTILKLEKNPNLALFAVFDGHGGENVALYSGEHLHKRIELSDHFKKEDYSKCLKEAFLGLDIDLRSDPDFSQEASGCTAVCALISNDKIFVGNAGDSRAVLSTNGEVKELSFDHKPQNPEESARISNAGGFVEAGRVNGNLALSRAIGDFEFKKNSRMSAEEQIVTANPEIIEHNIIKDDEFLVIACDGIWDCMSSQEVVTFVRQCIGQKLELNKICELLMDRCLAPDCDFGGIGCDNMTVIVVALYNGKTREQWYEDISNSLGPEQDGLHNMLSSDLLGPKTTQDFSNEDTEEKNNSIEE